MIWTCLFKFNYCECNTDNHIPLVVPGVQKTDDQTQDLKDRKQTRAVDDRALQVEREVPEWLQPFTEGVTRESSSSTDVSPADVAVPSRQHFFILRILQHNLHQTKQEENTIYSLVFPTDPNCEVCRRTKVTRAPCTRNPDDPSDRITFAEDFGDMITTDHKVLNEEQESRLHRTYAVIVLRPRDSMDSKLSMQNQSSSGDAEESSDTLTFRRKSRIQLYGQFSIIWDFKKIKKPAWSWIGIMRDLRSADPQHME